MDSELENLRKALEKQQQRLEEADRRALDEQQRREEAQRKVRT